MKYSQGTLNEPCQKLIFLGDALFNLSEQLVDSFNQNARIPSQKLELASCYLFNRARQDYRSICILCAEGIGSSSLPILRSLFESSVSFKYILSPSTPEQRENLANRFMDFECVETKKGLEYWKVAGQNQDWKKNFLDMEAEIQTKVNNFKIVYKISSKSDLDSWSGKNIRTMAKILGMENDYLSIYRFCCSLSHPSLIGAKQNIVPNLNGFDLHLQSEPSMLVANMQTAIEYYSQFVNTFNLVFKLNFDEELKHFIQSRDQVFRETNSLLVLKVS